MQSNKKPHVEFKGYITGMVATLDVEIDTVAVVASALKSDQSAYRFFREPFDKAWATLDALKPATGTDLAVGKIEVVRLTVLIDGFETAADWPAALADVRTAKTLLTQLLAANEEGGADVATIAWKNSALFESARVFGDDLDTAPPQPILTAKTALALETTEMGKAQKQLDWKTAKTSLETMIGLAKTVTSTT